jgi:hypothetical protein
MMKQKDCRNETYIDVLRAKARIYRQMCTTRPRAVATSTLPTLPTNNSSTASSSGSKGLKAATSTLITNISNTLRQRASKNTQPCSSNQTPYRTANNTSNNTPSPKSIHWCVDDAARRTLYHNICIEKKKGKDFINELCKSYRKLRGWKWFLSMTTCAEIRLVKVSYYIFRKYQQLI